MSVTDSFLFTGVVFGLTAGFSPGPLLTLVISETLRHNRSEGIKVALAPLLTDIPIVLVTFLILSGMKDYGTVLGVIAILGGLFVAYLGYESIRTKGLIINTLDKSPKSIRRGIMVNLASPHPYLFWLTVGAPIVVKAYQNHILTAFLFIVSFYVCLVGSKILSAVLVDKSRNFFHGVKYKWIMRILGIALMIFAILFIRDGLKLFEIY